MTEPIFVKTRYQDVGYHSYNDFWKLVELSGYSTCYVDQIDAYDPRKIYIITPLNDEWLQGWPGALARIIHFELEWRWDWRANVNEPPGVKEVWCGDKAYAQRIHADYVPLGSHAGLNELPNMPRHPYYDLCFMGYRDPARRAFLLREIAGTGLTIAPDGWGVRRSEIMLQSACMAIIHQIDKANGIAPLRMCIAAAHRLPVITEVVDDAGIFTNAFMMQCDYATLPYFLHDRIKDKDRQRFEDRGHALFDYLCHDYTFRMSIDSNL